MIEKVIFAVLAPGLGAGVLVLLAWAPWGRRRPRWGGAWSGAVAIAGGFGASFVVVAGWPRVPPEAQWHWIVLIVPAIALLAILPGLGKRARLLGWAAPLAAGVVAAALFVPPQAVESPWPWRGLLGVLVAGLGLGLEPLAARRAGASMPLALCVWVAGASVLITEAGVATTGLMVASASAALGAMVVVSWLRPSLTVARGTTLTVCGLVPASLAVGWLWTRDFTHVPAWSFGIAALAPLALWLGEVNVVRARRAWVAVGMRAALVAIPVAIALILAMKNAGSDPYGYG